VFGKSLIVWCVRAVTWWGLSHQTVRRFDSRW